MTEREEFLNHLRDIRKKENGNVDEGNMFWTARVRSEGLNKKRAEEENENVK